jgi:hypothetical protein
MRDRSRGWRRYTIKSQPYCTETLKKLEYTVHPGIFDDSHSEAAIDTAILNMPIDDKQAEQRMESDASYANYNRTAFIR